MATPDALLNPTAETHNLKRWTVQAYHRMGELGLLDASDRTELISGQITLMAAKGTPHVTALRLLAIELDDCLADRPFFVSTQDPIHIDDLSEPEPDLAIVRGAVLDYADHHPRPEDVCLIVEVADPTLRQDCEVKGKLYAQANIAEYWVIDLENNRLHIFQNPTPTGYSSHLILSAPNQASPADFPTISLSLTSIFPPTA